MKDTHPDYSKFNWANMQRERIKKWRVMSYAESAKLRDYLESEWKRRARILAAIPGAGAGPMEVTPDTVKNSPQYRLARANNTSAKKEMQDLNKWFCKRFKNEKRAGMRARELEANKDFRGDSDVRINTPE